MAIPVPVFAFLHSPFSVHLGFPFRLNMEETRAQRSGFYQCLVKYVMEKVEQSYQTEWSLIVTPRPGSQYSL